MTMLAQLFNHKLNLIVFILNLIIGFSSPSPDVTFSCDGSLDTEPHYGSGGYKLHIEGSPAYYQPNRAYTVTLLSTGRQSFRAFHISVKSEETTHGVGRFETYNNFTSQAQNECRFSNMVNKHMGKKSYVRVKWLSPATRSGCILLKASVHEKGSRWYRDHDKLTTRICEKNINDAPTDECCACGSATYRMKFYGIWSPQTHPRDYPEYSTHWSNVVGASHTPEYSIWEYGKVSSDAVQQIAEWGFPEKLLHELAALEEHDVLSVVKTKAQWPAYPVNGRFIPLVANFKTDQRRFLVTLLSMLGPSPDWNVGISKESMCLSSCGWVGKREYFLTPWDAGTDDGISYNSPNLPSNPRKPIRPINSTDHPDSPFYDESGTPISPVARIVIERVQLDGEQCGESEEVAILDDAEDINADDTGSNSQSITGCMYSDWFDWMPCSVSCGWGLKNRKRMLKAGKDMMCTDLMQTEICKGSEICENSENVTTCIYSEWTSWTRCSASCGESVRSRQRVMKWPSEPAFCNAPLKESVQCQQPSCDEACLYSPWSGWMPCSTTCGAGTTFRKRGLKVGNPEICASTREESECMTSMNCFSDSRFDVPECTYGPWMEWSVCPAECGAGQTFRKRMLVDSSPTARCEGFQMESSKCMTSMSCAVERLLNPACEWREWSTWTPCSVTCGLGMRMRQKFSVSQNEDWGCGVERIVMKEMCLPTKTCLLACNYQEWNEWMPCSVSCGNGATIRKRFLNTTVQNGMDCEIFEMEKNRCMVPCQNMSSPTNGISGCIATPWQEWSACSQSCGKNGLRTRTRNNPTLPGCLETAQKKCAKLPRCPRDCLMGPWSEWRSCKKPCMKGNRNAKTYRRRKTLKKAKFGGQGCGRKREVKPCTCP